MSTDTLTRQMHESRAHIAARPGIVEELAAKWGVKS